jgi:hypothetical protein
LGGEVHAVPSPSGKGRRRADGGWRSGHKRSGRTLTPTPLRGERGFGFRRGWDFGQALPSPDPLPAGEREQGGSGPPRNGRAQSSYSGLIRSDRVSGLLLSRTRCGYLRPSW